MKQISLNFFTVGTASWDSLNVIDTYVPDRKVPATRAEQTGGVGFNALSVALHMANLFDKKAQAILCTKLGADTQQNYYKPLVERCISVRQNIEVINVNKDDPNARTPNFSIIIEKSGQRFIPMPAKQVRTDFNTIASPDSNQPPKTGLTKAISDTIIRASKDAFVILTSRQPEESLLASKNGAKVALDLNFDDQTFKDSPHLDEIISNSDYIWSPVETLLPGMKRENPDQLIKILTERYDVKHIAISDGEKPVTIISNGQEVSFDTPPITAITRDVLGCGDARTGAASFALACGLPFIEATKFGTAMASFTANHIGRSWTNPIYTDNLMDLAKKHKLQFGE